MVRVYKYHCLVIFLSLIFIPSPTNAEVKRTKCPSEYFINSASIELMNNGFADYQFKSFQLNEQKLKDILTKSNSIILNDFPIDEQTAGNIKLNRIKSCVDCNTKFVSQSQNGETTIAPTDVSLFDGEIEGETGSKVILTNVDGIVYCVINHADGRSFVLAPSNQNIVQNGNYALVNQSHLVSKNLKPIDFGVNEKIKSQISNKIKSPEIALNWGKLLEAELALETDTEFFKSCGSDLKKAQAYAISLINMVSLLYIREVNIAIKLTWLKTWTDSPADPYDVKGDAYALPPKVLDYWKNNYKNVQRDLAQVVTSISYGGGGFGYFNGLCGNAGDYSFAVSSVQGNHSYPTVDFTYDVYIIAHEMGHNFNASHTHSCDFGYPLDTCVVADAIAGKCLDSSIKEKPNPGSIMSYCGSANNNAGLGYWVRMIFLEQSKQQIRKAAEDAVCITEPVKPMVVLNYPKGNEIFKPNDTLSILWSASGISNVDIGFSFDSGRSWINIAKSVNASNNRYPWKIPNICSDKMLIAISETLSDSVIDIMKIPFKVIRDDPDGLVAYYPFSGNFQDYTICQFYNLERVGKVDFEFDLTDMNVVAKFDGQSYLNYPKFPFTFDELTFSFWFKTDDMNQKRNIIGTNYEEGWITEVYLWGQFGASYYIDGQGAPKQVWGGFPELNKWHHGAFTWDGMTAKLYLDGKLAGQQSDGKHSLNKFSPTPLYIGSRKANDYFKGSLDEIYIYKRALSEAEIVKLFNQQPNTVENNIQLVSDFEIFPNPAKDKIFIELKGMSVRKADFIITDLLGRTVKRISQDITTSDYLFPVEINDLESGIYFIKLETTVIGTVKKLIVTP